MDLNLLMQGSPAKALELFTKLADPSDASAKARGKLFTELKAEIDLHLKTEEEYLLPILLKNPDTKALAQEGINNNRELRTKLTAIDAMSKTDSSFIGKLKDLQQAFRHHARDEKNDLLPAVKRALTDFHQSSVVASAAPMMASSQGHHAEPLSETPTAIPLAKANPAKATEMSKPADSTAKADHAQVQQRPVQPQFNEGRMTAAKSPSPSLAELFFWPWAGTMQALSGSKAFPVVRGPSNLEEVLPLGEEVIEVGKRTVQLDTVRVHRQVVETPFEEKITLYSERVIVERRRPSTNINTGEILTDVTIEVHETREEAVIQKHVQLREEVVIRTERSAVTEVIRDTLRRDEVHVEQSSRSPSGRPHQPAFQKADT